jgi:CheY-like chemotaxis protein
MKTGKPINIVMADDDPDDRMLTRDALAESHLANDLFFVEDGEELMDFLLHRGRFADVRRYPRPDLILLDLHMPRKDGREALREIKADDSLKQIVIIVLTTSQAEEDIFRSYQLGVNSFITKPVSFEALVDTMRTVSKYWFQIVKLPNGNGNGGRGHEAKRLGGTR